MKRIAPLNYWKLAKWSVGILAFISLLALIFKARMLFVFVEFFGGISLLGVVALIFWEMIRHLKDPEIMGHPPAKIPVQLKITKRKAILKPLPIKN